MRLAVEDRKPNSEYNQGIITYRRSIYDATHYNYHTMNQHTRVLTIHFNEEIAPYETKLFRGAILNVLGEQADILFHNHKEDGFNYAYPLIQYKRIHKKAAIVCLNEGADIIGLLLSKVPLTLTLGERIVEFSIEKIIPQRITTQIWDDAFKYHLRRWLPLNSENYKTYRTLETEVERIELLERLLTANLMSYLKGMGIWIEQKLSCKILKLSPPFLVKNKEISLMSFDIDFKTNLSLPNYIGVGKNSSLGFGTITQIRQKNQTEKI